MSGLTVTVLQFEIEVLSSLALGAQKGLALRGGLFESLRDNLNVCLYKELTTCQPCTLRQVCPLSGLLATVDDAAPRGHDAPRPMAIQPPTDGRRVYSPGDTIGFGVTLFGAGARYVPYLVLAARELERSGLGARPGCRPGTRPCRGAVRLGAVRAANPFTGADQLVRAAGDNAVRPCEVVVTAADVDAYAATLPADELTLELVTPLRLIDQGQLVKPLRFDALVQRLTERLDALVSYYGTVPFQVDGRDLVEPAARVEVARDATRWVDVLSHSRRTNRWSPVGGYVGRVAFRGDLAPFLPWLVWGTLTHVGKSATRGNGWYRIVPAGEVVP